VTPKRPRPGIREANKDALQCRIEEAALKLFAEEGFANTTVGQIAAAADIAERTFYRHFPTKQDVVFWRTKDRTEWLRTALRELGNEYPSSSDLDWLVKGLEGYAVHVDDDQGLSRLRALTIRSSAELTARAGEVYAMWGDLFASEVSRRRGKRAPDLSARVASSIALSLLGAAFAEWARQGGRTSLEVCMGRVLDAFRAITDPMEVRRPVPAPGR